MSLIKIVFAFYGNNKEEHDNLINKLKAEREVSGSGFSNYKACKLPSLDFSKIKIKEIKNLQPDHAHGKVGYVFTFKLEREIDGVPYINDLELLFKEVAPDLKYFYQFESSDYELYVNTDKKHLYLSPFIKLMKFNKKNKKETSFYFANVTSLNRFINQSFPGSNVAITGDLDSTFDAFSDYLISHYYKKFPNEEISLFIFDLVIPIRFTIEIPKGES